MSSRDWNRVDDVKPPNGEEVRVMSHSGQVTNLVRDGNLWWFPDRSMYVYWTPAYWQHIEETP